MRTGVGLGVIAIGAILAFAVTANTSVVNIHTAGWVLMLVGLAGILIPRRTYGWLGRRVLVRRRIVPGTAEEAEEIAVPPYAGRNQGTSRIRAGLPSQPTSNADINRDPIGEAELRRRTAPAETEVVEDLYEELRQVPGAPGSLRKQPLPPAPPGWSRRP